MLRTIHFFSDAINKRGANIARIVSGAFIDALATAFGVVAPLLFVMKLNDEELEASIETIMILSSAIFLSKILPKFRGMMLTPVAASVQKELTLDMLAKCYDLELNKHLSQPTGQFAETLSRNYTTVDKLMPVMFGEILPFVIETIGITAALTSRDYYLAAFPPGAIGLFLGVAAIAESSLTSARKELSDVRNKAFGMLLQAIGNYSVAHQFGNTDFELQKVKPTMGETETLYTKTFLISQGVAVGQTVINYLSMGGAILYSAYRYQQGSLTSLDLALISYLMTQFTFRLEGLSSALSQLHAVYTDAQKIIEFSDLVSKVADPIGAKSLVLNAPPSIKFDKVSFSYPASPGQQPKPPVLNKLSFSIEPGQTVAIVGATGAGKSTIIQLLLRFFHPAEGEILINGQDIAQTKMASLRDVTSLVSQDAGLFNATIRENIRYGNLNAEDAEIDSAAYYAGLIPSESDVAMLNVAVGERGQQQSGGERQRIAIARALLKGGLIMLLDEPTSALDPEKEKAVLGNLEAVNGGATTLIVTHKLYTLTHVNKILYLDHGTIIEEGSFSQLIEKKGRFFQQLQAQCETLAIDVSKLVIPEEIKPNSEKKVLPLSQPKVSVVSNWHKRHRGTIFVGEISDAASTNSRSIKEYSELGDDVPLLTGGPS